MTQPGVCVMLYINGKRIKIRINVVNHEQSDGTGVLVGKSDYKAFNYKLVSLQGFETKTSSATKNSVVCKPFIENGSEENHSKDEVPKMFRDKDKEYTFTEKIDELYIKELVLKESSVI
jgi:hypothetical protein